MIRKIFVCTALLILPAIVNGQDLEGVKCVMNPKADAKAEATAEHMKGTVYFCCNNCAAKFKESPDEHIAAANFQLVATGQYEQKACPFSGGAVTDGNVSKIGEMEVGFCCDKCKGKADGAENMAAQVSMIFGKETFEKGFAKVESDDIDLSRVVCPMMGEEVAAEFVAEHLDGKIYFCCESCVDAFTEDPAKYAVVANQQLVSTGQYVQKACPFSGGPVKDDQSVKVGETEVGFCCGNCKAKVESADEEARNAMIFGEKAFAKGFAKKEN